MSEENASKREREAMSRADADLELNLLLAEIEGPEPSDELIRKTSEGIRAAIAEFDARESVAATVTGSESSKPFCIERLCDFLAFLPRLTLVKLDVGLSAHGYADTRPKGTAGRQSKPSHYCTWKQDALRLTLSCMHTKPYTVTLHVDEGSDVELSELGWIDEDALRGEPDSPVAPKKFRLQRIDESTYRVDMHLGVFTRRMGSLTAASESASARGVDPRLLLPFVN